MLKVSEEARRLHEDSHVIDLHVDSLLLARQFGYDITRRHRAWLPGGALGSHADLPRMRQGGIDTVGFGLVVNPLAKPFKRWQNALYQAELFKKTCRDSAGLLQLAGCAHEARALKADNKFGAFLGMEGAHGLGDDIFNLKEARDVGVRYITLTHLSANKAAHPAKGKGANPKQGISDWGFALIEEMNSLGILVDLAHVNKKGFMQAIEHSKTPCIVSHAGVMSEHDHWRNLDDEQIRAIAKSGGTIGLIFAPNYLCGKRRCKAEVVIRHMEYIIMLVGEDHVSIGSDFDGYIVGTPDDLRDASYMPTLTQLMLERYWSEERIRKVLGGNFLRVFEEVCCDVPVLEANGISSI